MKNCGTTNKRKFERLDGKSWGNVFCIALNMALPFGFENQFERIKKPTETQTPRNYQSKLSVLWQSEGCNVFCAKKFRSSTYSIIYNEATR